MDEEVVDKKPSFRGEFDAVHAPLTGANLIEAGAGTGKTYAITCLYLRLLVERGLAVREILVVTFTVAATNELTERIRDIVAEAIVVFRNGGGGEGFLSELYDKFTTSEERITAVERLSRALADFDEAAIHTIHGFCRRVLQENAFESGELFDTELITDDREIRMETVEDFWRRNFYEAPPEFMTSKVHFVDYALKKGVNPQSLLGFVGDSRFLAGTKVVPPEGRPALEEQARIVSELEGEISELCELWPVVRDEVRLILTGNALKKNSYGDKVPKFIAGMDSFIACARPPLFPDDFFEKFTPDFIAARTCKGAIPPRHHLFDLCGQIIKLSSQLQRLFDDHLLYLKQRLLRTMAEELPRKKQARNVQFFDDLLFRLHRAILEDDGKSIVSAIRRRYRAALIDEFQDTDPLQYTIFSRVFRTPATVLFLIGDPKQAIYSFRGADIFAYMTAAKEVDYVYTLTANWRSDPALIEAVNTIFSVRENPFVFPEIEYRKATPGRNSFADRLIINGVYPKPMKCWFMDSEGEKPAGRGVIHPRIVKAVAAEIARLLSSGKSGSATIGNRAVQAADIAILVRTNPEARQCRNALAALNIPAVLHSAESVFSSREALEMERFLLAVHLPERYDLLLAALATDMIGCDLRSLYDLGADEDRREQWQEKFIHYHELAEKNGLLRMFRFFIEQEGVRGRLLSFPDGERRLTNMLHLAEALQTEAEEQNMAPDALLSWLAARIENPGREEHQLRLETDRAAVEIVTIHKSKGLQYPIVFCPFVWEGYKKPGSPLFYHEHAGGLVCDLGSDEYSDHLLQADQEMLAEDIRLFYVAMTRAVSSCIFVWGWINLSEKSAPAYLFHGGGTKSGELSATATNYNQLSSDAVRARMQAIAEETNGAMELLTIPDSEGTSALDTSLTGTVLACRKAGRAVDHSWRVASFSYLSQYSDRNDEDIPVLSLPGKADQDASDPVLNFPPGPGAGVLLHEILEKCDFAKGDDPALPEMIAVKLRENGFDSALQGVVREMINRVVNHPLTVIRFNADTYNCNSSVPDIPMDVVLQGVQVQVGDDKMRRTAEQRVIHLRDIMNNQRLNELEFYFPLKDISPGRLREIFIASGAFGEIPFTNDFILSLKRLQFDSLRGFMRGFMDMVFRTEGRWYLVDWKSNLLGKSRHDYSREKLLPVMVEHQYVLQYYIYLMALHAYLKSRQPGYDYNLHFGGVFYLFLRGMNPVWGAECGVYFDRPDPERIEFLCSEMLSIRL